MGARGFLEAGVKPVVMSHGASLAVIEENI
jgi:hypothetical protein